MSIKAGVNLKEEGITRALRHKHKFVKDVREHLASLAMQQGTVTADDAWDYAQRMGISLGNSAGGIFREPRWDFTGEWVPSRRTSNHAHRNRVWRLRDTEATTKGSVKAISPTQYKRERDALGQMYENGTEFNGPDGSDRYDRACEHLRRGLEAWYAQ